MKKNFLVFVMMLVITPIIFVGQVNSEELEEMTLKLGHGAQLSHPLQDTSERFAEIIEEKTNGKIKVEIYGNTQIGEEREMVEGLQIGTVDLVITSTGPLGGFVSDIGVFDLPFLFESSEHAYRVLDGEIGQSILDKFDSAGIIGLSFMENGWRNISTTDKKIIRPSDLEGLKIRTMENKVHLDSFKALGASPIPMAWGEVYTSLQQGIIDGQENPVPIIYTNKLWEVQDYYALTRHFYTPYAFLMSKISWNKIPEETQKLIKETALEVSQYQRNLMQEDTEAQIELLEKEDLEVYEVDRSLFREATKSVYDKYEDEFGNLVEQIKNAAN